MLICGSGSFDQSEYDENEISRTTTNPKRTRRSTSFGKIIGKDNNNNKNPYADRGLDKFHALLADLDTKKQHIYTQKGSKDISFVRFTYTDDSNRVKPIVVRVKNKNKQEKTTKTLDKIPQNTTSETVEVTKQGKKQRRTSLLCSGPSFKVEDLRRPCVYLPFMLVMILLFLVLFGRSFAILCASIGWYAVPTLIGEASSTSTSTASSSSSSTTTIEEVEGKSRKRPTKEYLKKVSQKRIVHSSEGPSSPTSVLKWADR